jgi:hypothetical protein
MLALNQWAYLYLCLSRIMICSSPNVSNALSFWQIIHTLRVPCWDSRRYKTDSSSLFKGKVFCKAGSCQEISCQIFFGFCWLGISVLIFVFHSHICDLIVHQGDLAILNKKCFREVVERCRAERRALESQGIYMDNKVKLKLSCVPVYMIFLWSS